MAVTATQLAATLWRRQKEYVNIIQKENALWTFLTKKGQYKSARDGQKFEWPVEWKFDTDREASFSGLDVRPYQHQDNVILAAATRKLYDWHLVISKDEELENDSDARTFDLLAQKEENMLNTARQVLNDHSYLDGTGNDSKRITGLAASIAAAPGTGTLYGIDRSVYTDWQNQNKDTNAAYNSGGTSRKLIDDMEALRILCGRRKTGKQRYPDLILSTETYYLWYTYLLQQNQRFTNTTMLDAGFENTKFHRATMIEDESVPADAGSDQQAYHINSDFIEIRYHPKANFSLTDPIVSDSQWQFHIKMLWSGEIVVKHPAKHGLHQGVKVSS